MGKKEAEVTKSSFSEGYGGKFGVQQDRVDKSALGYGYLHETTKHSSQTDYKSGFGGKFGVESEKKDKSAVGFDHVEKLSKHSSQTDYSSGFGGKFGVSSASSSSSSSSSSHAHDACQQQPAHAAVHQLLQQISPSSFADYHQPGHADYRHASLAPNHIAYHNANGNYYYNQRYIPHDLVISVIGHIYIVISSITFKWEQNDMNFRFY